VNLETIFDEYDAERAFNLIDYLLVEDAIYDGANQGNVTKIRAIVNKSYGRTRTMVDEDGFEITVDVDSDSGEFNYVEQTEQGYLGLEAPMG